MSYAGLKNSKYYNLGKKYFPYGVGSIFTVKLKNGYKSCVSMVEKANLLSHVANVGDTRSLIIHPASTTHAQMDAETMKLAGLTEDMIRFSVGIEDIDDIINDFENGFRAAKKPRLVINK